MSHYSMRSPPGEAHFAGKNGRIKSKACQGFKNRHFLHGFQKKTQKTPRREIEIALKRLASFLEREGGK